MSHAARVLVVGNEGPGAGRLSSRLTLCGCECETVEPETPEAQRPHSSRADVVILNLLSELGRQRPGAFVDFARKLKRHSCGPLVPILMIGGSEPEHTACAIDAAANSEIDDVMLSPVNDLHIVARIRSLMRLNTMHDELVRRLNTSSRYGIDAPASIPGGFAAVDDANVLVVGATETFAAIETALHANATLVGALSTSTALDYLARKSFDIIIVDVPDDAAGALEFTRLCRANTRLFNTPILLIATPGNVPDTASVFQHGVTDLVAKPPRPEELRVRVQALVREVRFRDSLRQIYAQARHMATSDALTGLYTRGFALEHLQGMIRTAPERALPFTVAYGRINNLKEINALHGFAVGDRIIRQVGDVLGLLVRGEDLTARFKGPEFIILMPDTTEASASSAVGRILGVINHTEFTIPELPEALPVTLSVATTSFREGDTAEGIVARAARGADA